MWKIVESESWTSRSIRFANRQRLVDPAMKHVQQLRPTLFD
jgi:hypothetical protein